MASRLRRRFGLLLLLLIVVGGLWLYVVHVPRIDLATRIPASAIGYLEINDWPQLAGKLTSTTAWRELAPVYGLWNKWGYLGTGAWLLKTTGIGPRDAVVLSRAQLAVVVTSIEARGEDVRPRLALVLETHSRESQLDGVIESRVPEFAARAFGNPVREKSEYAGVPVTIFRNESGDRRILSARVGSQWVVSNHAEAMEACLDAKLGRTPNMSTSFYLQNARPVVANEGQVFGFVSGEGTTRLTRFASELVGARLFGNSPLTEALRSVVSDLSSVASNGIAYGMTIESGHTVERYAWLCHPQIVEQLRPSVHVKEGLLELPRFAPSSIDKLSIIRVTDPDKTFAALESVISSRLGAAQSYIFHRFVIGAREALFGLKESENFGTAVGDELGSISFGGGSDDSVWVVSTRDRPSLERLTERFLTQNGATISHEAAGANELLVSSDQRRGAASFVERFLVLGSREAVIKLIETRNANPSPLSQLPQLAAAHQFEPKAPIVTVASARGETAELMEDFFRLLPYSGVRVASEKALDSLPLATSSLAIGERSFVLESHSPFGSLPFIMSLFRPREPQSRN